MPEETEAQRTAKASALRGLFDRSVEQERFYRSPLNHVIGLTVNAGLAALLYFGWKLGGRALMLVGGTIEWEVESLPGPPRRWTWPADAPGQPSAGCTWSRSRTGSGWPGCSEALGLPARGGPHQPRARHPGGPVGAPGATSRNPFRGADLAASLLEFVQDRLAGAVAGARAVVIRRVEARQPGAALRRSRCRPVRRPCSCWSGTCRWVSRAGRCTSNRCSSPPWWCTPSPSAGRPWAPDTSPKRPRPLRGTGPSSTGCCWCRSHCWPCTLRAPRKNNPRFHDGGRVGIDGLTPERGWEGGGGGARRRRAPAGAWRGAVARGQGG